MRALSNVVVLTALLGGAAALAGTGTSPASATPAAAPAGSAAPAPQGSDAAASAGSANAPAPENPDDVPTAIRIKRLEQRTQELKEKTFQLKARMQSLKEQMLGGGVGAQAVISHSNDMGSSFRLVKLVYTLDGAQVLSQDDDAGESLYKVKSFDVINGPIAPGNHNLAVVATYRGHGYDVFAYLSKYTFVARGAVPFTAAEGKITKIDCRGYDKNPSLQMKERAAIDCKVTQIEPEKPETPTSTTPGATPLPPAAGPAVGK